ncbi:hypothetical protein GW17_00046341 [Ensete ventricosum]|nr:hypothetical protein GW17_00046341 [Ensete ventricosum]
MRVALETERVGEQKKRQKGEKRRKRRRRRREQNTKIKGSNFSVSRHFLLFTYPSAYTTRLVRTHFSQRPHIPLSLSLNILAFPKVKISDSRASVSKPPLRNDCCVKFVLLQTPMDGVAVVERESGNLDEERGVLGNSIGFGDRGSWPCAVFGVPAGPFREPEAPPSPVQLSTSWMRCPTGLGLDLDTLNHRFVGSEWTMVLSANLRPTSFGRESKIDSIRSTGCLPIIMTKSISSHSWKFRFHTSRNHAVFVPPKNLTPGGAYEL